MNEAEKLSRLADLAREGIPADVDAAHDAAERARFVEAVSRGAALRRGGAWGRVDTWLRSLGVSTGLAERPRWGLALAGAAALAVALVVLWPTRRLDYAVEGAPVATGGYISAAPGDEARLRFTDGTTVALSPGSALRVAEVEATGARMLLEHGRASLRVTPRPKARWSVEAGPFAVLVTGTAFDVSWTRGDGTLRVDLHEGSVTVRGPLAPDGLPLRAGQRLVARLHEGDVQISSADAASAAGATQGGPSSAAQAAQPGAAQPGGDGRAAGSGDAAEPGAEGDAGAARAEGSRAEGSPGGAPPDGAGAAPDGATAADGAAAAPSWAKRVAAGDFRSVLAEAEQRGLGGVLERGSLDDLVALADAARYARRGDVAQRALTATRKRFPGTSHGKAAAFLLGRMVDDGGSPGAAVAWYDTYLAESPGGPFAAEALGRKMVAVERTGGRAAARPIAELYLKRHPRGAHAPVASDLMKP
ncbi:FecR domain-containing protein [Sorangium sp. So ce1099]|uniref:FecR domain-containing protein n=1 Tax=Sorangium sp. So ce1099 TaxID=3133331 RepID=UPI003F60891E